MSSSRIRVWGQKGQKFPTSEKYSEEGSQKALKTKALWRSERGNSDGLQKLCPFCPLMASARRKMRNKKQKARKRAQQKAPDTATARAKKHDRASDRMEKSVSGPVAEEPSATESEILPLHKPAVYAKDFVLRRPSGGKQKREEKIPCQDIPSFG